MRFDSSKSWVEPGLVNPCWLRQQAWACADQEEDWGLLLKL